MIELDTPGPQPDDTPVVVVPAVVDPPVPLPKSKARATTRKAPARAKSAAKAKPTPKATTTPADGDPEQAIALHCLHPSRYVEHMPFPGRDVTREWVKARLVYRERLDEVLASEAYAKTDDCPHLPHDPLCGR